MALPYVITKLDQVDAAVRAHYVRQDDGTFTLAAEGEPPKLKEFRETNVKLLKDLARFEGIDPDAAKADRQKLADYEKTKPHEQVASLQAELAAEKAARIQAEQTSSRSRLRDTLRSKLLDAGVLPAAIDLALDRAESSFTMTGDAVTARPNTFSPTQPGQPLTPDEWIANATRELSFLFAPSSGAGARKVSGGTTVNPNVLRDPTPQQLGENAKDIASGKLKVVYGGGE